VPLGTQHFFSAQRYREHKDTQRKKSRTTIFIRLVILKILVQNKILKKVVPLQHKIFSNQILLIW